MNENAALGAIKRRWWIIVLFVAAGALVGALPEPEQVDESEIERTFIATHTMLSNQNVDEGAVSTAVQTSQVTLFATTGEVPARAAVALGYDGNPAALASQLFAEFDFSSGALTLTVSGDDPERVVSIADTFADELTSYLFERQDVVYEQRLAASSERLAEREAALIEITRDLSAAEDDPVLTAQQGAISRQYSVAFEQAEALRAAPPVLGFTTLERAQAVEITDTSRGLAAPASRTSRALLGAVVGGAVGIAVALLLGRVDRKLRTRDQAETATDMRARVMIPKVRDPDRDRLVIASNRHDALSDSYRTVRNLVEFVQGPLDSGDHAPVVLVVSPSPSDGKTTLAANLAAAAAEAGQRTILVNADFRRPRLTSVFGPEAGEPLPFLIDDIDTLSARALLGKSGVERLRLFDLASVEGSAGELVRATVDKLDEMTKLGDLVVVDTSPVGATAEVLDLVPHADTIVMVMRVGNTTTAQAERAVGILRDLTTVPTMLVLGGLKNERTQYYEYSDRRKAPRASRRWWPRRRRRADTPTAETNTAIDTDTDTADAEIDTDATDTDTDTDTADTEIDTDATDTGADPDTDATDSTGADPDTDATDTGADPDTDATDSTGADPDTDTESELETVE